MNDRDVVVTGVGAVSCLGAGATVLWEGMEGAHSTPRPVDDPQANMAHPLMYLVPSDTDVGPEPSAADLGHAAVTEALRQSGWDPASGSNTGLVLGSGMGQSRVVDQERSQGKPPSEENTLFATVADVARRTGCDGPVHSVSNACAAGGFAVSMAADLIRSGAVDVAVAGGSEAYSRVALGCFNRLGAVDPQRCRPFSADRAGTVFGEGSAAVVLESAEHARRRGATPQAVLSASAWSCDAHHATAPEPDGRQIRRAIDTALREADAKPADVGAVIPHGTGTELNDQIEGQVLAEALEHRPPAYSLKALLGHTGGAAGALAVVAGVLMLRHGEVPNNVAVGPTDDACAVNLNRESVALDRSRVMVNAYAFGGNNISLLLEGVR
ncbi:beta-ketoacyl synthase N-terminal-like domain-containing protein [Haloglycomyces albus]|uniref:beta-ketoacyl synthase N-terminal-like domain-containing protein n=1 Tax=Haloglycomyces albus TaxID=526067 RepID=UPI00046D7A80|nr:beta-ketoacyl synthase N-terminal-like domain-containing protein [Haloglycomyces albus]